MLYSELQICLIEVPGHVLVPLFLEQRGDGVYAMLR
jgi:hypothetical protein